MRKVPLEQEIRADHVKPVLDRVKLALEEIAGKDTGPASMDATEGEAGTRYIVIRVEVG